jgi:hypothetical protein
MTNRNIYLAALSVLQENEEDCEDYAVRAPMLLAAFVRRVAALDAWYREAHGLERAPVMAADVTPSLDETFALSPRFSPAAAYDLAAQLVGRDHGAFADRCAGRCEAELELIRRTEIPATLHPIA